MHHAGVSHAGHPSVVTRGPKRVALRWSPTRSIESSHMSQVMTRFLKGSLEELESARSRLFLDQYTYAAQNIRKCTSKNALLHMRALHFKDAE